MKPALKTNVYDCSVVELPKIFGKSGSITVIDNGKGVIEFDIKRVFYLYDVPGGESRGAHAHKECEQLIISGSGSYEVQLDDGSIKRHVILNRPYFGLYVPAGIWNSLNNFSSGAVSLVMASHEYDKDDYIRSYEEFLNFKLEK